MYSIKYVLKNCNVTKLFLSSSFLYSFSFFATTQLLISLPMILSPCFLSPYLLFTPFFVLSSFFTHFLSLWQLSLLSLFSSDSSFFSFSSFYFFSFSLHIFARFYFCLLLFSSSSLSLTSWVTELKHIFSFLLFLTLFPPRFYYPLHSFLAHFDFFLGPHC